MQNLGSRFAIFLCFLYNYTIMEQENNITIDELARMIKKGFDETAKKSDVEEIKKILL